MAMHVTVVIKPEEGATLDESIAAAGLLVVEMEGLGWWFAGYDLETATKLGCAQDLCPRFFKD